MRNRILSLAVFVGLALSLAHCGKPWGAPDPGPFAPWLLPKDALGQDDWSHPVAAITERPVRIGVNNLYGEFFVGLAADGGYEIQFQARELLRGVLLRTPGRFVVSRGRWKRVGDKLFLSDSDVNARTLQARLDVHRGLDVLVIVYDQVVDVDVRGPLDTRGARLRFPPSRP